MWWRRWTSELWGAFRLWPFALASLPLLSLRCCNLAEIFRCRNAGSVWSVWTVCKGHRGEPFWDSCGHSSVGASTPLREVSRVSRLEKHEKSCKSAKRSLQILGDAFSRRWKKSNRCVFLFLFFENLSDQINALEKRFANGEVSVCSDFWSNFLQALMQKRDSDPLESRVSERRFLK